MTATVAVIPVKQLTKSKQRLRDLLDRDERIDLSIAMLKDVLTTLKQCTSISRILIITKDTSVAAISKRFNAEILEEAAHSDLNIAAKQAVNYLLGQSAEKILILPGDIPFISVNDIQELLSSESQIAISPCQHNEGTNALCFSPRNAPDFSFGKNNFHIHKKSILNSGLSFQTIELDNIALDIDTPTALYDLQEKLFLKNSDWYVAPATRDFFIKHRNLFSRQLYSRLTDSDLTNSINELSLSVLKNRASQLRDQGHGNNISYSTKVFIPLTQLCRDVCHYCTFAKTPRKTTSPFLSEDEVLRIAKAGAKMGCKEALFTLGDKPETRYRVAREWLNKNGYQSTLDYLEKIAEKVFQETELLPHLNPGLMNKEEMQRLKQVSASMGIMLESASPRLCKKGEVHYGSPDKDPEKRLETIRIAGELKIPFTTGILIGIGETRQERIDSLFRIRELHEQYRHIQEIIIQNFRAKPETRMSHAPEPDLDDLMWTIATARLIFGPEMNIQVPPNLNASDLGKLVDAGVNDWGGVSPLTPDHVNPEAPWPNLSDLVDQTRKSGKVLVERLSVYPRYISEDLLSNISLDNSWLSANIASHVFKQVSGDGLVKDSEWFAGTSTQVPTLDAKQLQKITSHLPSKKLQQIVQRAEDKEALSEKEVIYLLQARENEFNYICRSADAIRKQTVGDTVTFVVNRNINYTNICTYKCQFCAFSKSQGKNDTRGPAYNLTIAEIVARVTEAVNLGATEVCLQGGIHPDYTGYTYIEICKAIKEYFPLIHIHAFSPLEIWQGAMTADRSLDDYLCQLKEAGLDTLPGTAAEILDDSVRRVICADKITSQQWLTVMETAHKVGLQSTATIMFGHVENYSHIANHLIAIRDLQEQTQGFTEFVPLPFVHHRSPIFNKGRSRRGPDFREALLIHAVSRLVLHGRIENIQGSWTKLGHFSALMALQAGANDFGGTLMNESITRAAGANHGQETSVLKMLALIESINRVPQQRTTRYDWLQKTKLYSTCGHSTRS